jgi:ubiquinone/menaquinone biosynthesis C-methylase UbiE
MMDRQTVEEQNLRAFDSPEAVASYTRSTSLMVAEAHLFHRHLRPGMAILDVGMGAGRTTPELSAMAREYVGLDYAPSMVEHCRTRFPSLRFEVGDAADLSRFPDGYFDAVVFSFNGIDCLYPDENRRRFLDEARRVLRPGGRLILSQHNARALFIVPLSEGPGLRNLARRLHYAVTENLYRLRTIPFGEAFRRGEGYVDDHNDGGMVLHAASRRKAVEETSAHGFELLEVVGSNHPAKLGTVFTPWWYYAFARR